MKQYNLHLRNRSTVFWGSVLNRFSVSSSGPSIAEHMPSVHRSWAPSAGTYASPGNTAMSLQAVLDCSSHEHGAGASSFSFSRLSKLTHLATTHCLVRRIPRHGIPFAKNSKATLHLALLWTGSFMHPCCRQEGFDLLPFFPRLLFNCDKAGRYELYTLGACSDSFEWCFVNTAFGPVGNPKFDERWTSLKLKVKSAQKHRGLSDVWHAPAQLLHVISGNGPVFVEFGPAVTRELCCCISTVPPGASLKSTG